MIVSLCNFKLRKVAPVSFGDRVWRQVAEAERFTAFLAFYADKDIEFVKSVARAVLDESSACIVRFEDMLEGSVRGAFRDRLDALISASPAASRAVLRAKLRTSNPTYSGRTADWRTVWDDRAERFFDELGLRA